MLDLQDAPLSGAAAAPLLQVPRHDECGYLGKPARPGDAARAVKLHSCDRHRRRRAAHARRRAAAAARDRTPKPCRHRAPHRHGTRGCYLADGCRCLPCEQANNAYHAERKRLIAAGVWDSMLDAGPVTAHLRALANAGLPAEQVAELAGVSLASVYRLLAGTGPGRRAIRVRTGIARRLLAVAHPEAVRLVDGIGTRRRLQALVATGWQPAGLDAELGEQAGWAERVLGADLIDTTTAGRVGALFERLWDCPPPQRTAEDQAAAEAARARAKQNGWGPPMAWDEDLNPIDDPTAEADLGAKVRSTKLPPAEELLFLLGSGESLEAIAHRFGVRVATVRQALTRARRAAEPDDAGREASVAEPAATVDDLQETAA